MQAATPAQIEFDRLRKIHALTVADVAQHMAGIASEHTVRSWFKSRKSRKARNISSAALYVLKSKLGME